MMVEDGATLAASQYMENKRVIDEGGKGGDDPVGCPDHTSRRTYQVTGDFGKVDGVTSTEQADLAGPPLRVTLRGMGYEPDDSASSVNQSGRSIGVLRKKVPGITFTVIVQSSLPNIEIIGKTDCLPAN
ncbi:hypothetical protein [Sphaerisporangium perillae]|uniref:hypothetical protein n=1 Tax=Sphaerisporangium perillae TaxID=2935860 RepID=UPI00200F555E|nr:hypothetical protein [Sphaerisporangium perillae]